MPKIFCAFLFVASSFIVCAQTKSGNMMVGGTVRITSNTLEGDGDYQNSSVTFSPDLGYFIKDNFAIGLSLSIGNRVMDTGDTRTQITSFGIGPYARYYMFTSNENFAFFGQAGLTVASGKRDDTPGGESKTGSILFAVSPGFAYFFNTHWALDLTLAGISFESYDPDKDVANDKQNAFIFGISSLSPSLGIRYHFFGK